MENKILERILESILRIEQNIFKRENVSNSKPISISEILKEAVTMHVGEDGEYDGVLIKTFDREFIVGLKNFFPESVNKVKLKEVMQDKEWRLPTPEEALLILLYRTELNTLLKRFGAQIDSANNDLMFWIKPTEDRNRYMKLNRTDEIFHTTSSDSKYFVRCVKDLNKTTEKVPIKNGTNC